MSARIARARRERRRIAAPIPSKASKPKPAAPAISNPVSAEIPLGAGCGTGDATGAATAIGAATGTAVATSLGKAGAGLGAGAALRTLAAGAATRRDGEVARLTDRVERAVGRAEGGVTVAAAAGSTVLASTGLSGSLGVGSLAGGVTATGSGVTGVGAWVTGDGVTGIGVAGVTSCAMAGLAKARTAAIAVIAGRLCFAYVMIIQPAAAGSGSAVSDEPSLPRDRADFRQKLSLVCG